MEHIRLNRAEPQFLRVTEGGEPRQIACLVQEGVGPATIWLGGFRSDMRATKAEALAGWAAAAGRRFVRFDYSGHGESGGDFADGCISAWLADALAVIAAHGGPRPVLVGSSMGGWLALLAARALAASGHAPCNLVLIAPAVDFTRDLMWAQMPQAAREAVMNDGHWMRPSAYSPEPYPITRRLIEDGDRHRLFGAPIEPGCPVTILQGMQDPDVPWIQAMKLMEHLPADDVTMTLVKDGDHRLSRPQDIALLIRTVETICAAAQATGVAAV
jgi:pimeloyl-ACP methyl ester carboxylesterase